MRTRRRKRFRCTARPCFRDAFTRSLGSGPMAHRHTLTSKAWSRPNKGRGTELGTA
jgi:hypothetical protein